jgi:hypothetical protein
MVGQSDANHEASQYAMAETVETWSCHTALSAILFTMGNKFHPSKDNLHLYLEEYGEGKSDVRRWCRELVNGQTPTTMITPLDPAHEGQL